MLKNKILNVSSRSLKWKLHCTRDSDDLVASYLLSRLNNSSRRFYSDTTPKDPLKAKEEKIESVKMPGFVHPDTMHEEGHFAQKAKQQLEELKKKLDKPKVENSERKD